MEFVKATRVAALLIVCFLIHQTARSQTVLSAGDLALSTINADGNDDFSFILFVEIASGTIIKFTDDGWDTNTNAFSTASEGIITWTASGTVAAGTEVRINNPVTTVTASTGNVSKSGTFNISGGGDQILVYQGTEASPTFIYAFSHRAGGFGLSVGGSSLNTNLPIGLESGTNALAISSHADNWQFKCTANASSLAQFMIEANYNSNSTSAFTSGAGSASGCAGGASTTPEINVQQSSTDIATGGSHGFGTVQIGTHSDVVFTVQNTGDADLNITSISPTGTGFTIQSAISANPVPASGSASFTVRFTPTATTQTAGSVTIVSDDADEGSYVINFTASVTNAILSIKVLLEGPLSGTTMSTNLNGALSTDPATVYSGIVSETSSAIPAQAVDWVVVELRSGTGAGSKVGTNRAGILKSDGSVVDKDGNPFTMSQVDGSGFYIVIHHRNHLSVMSNQAVNTTTGTYEFDFTTAQSNSFNNGSIGVGSVFAMYAGDADGNGTIDGSDLTTWRAHNGLAFLFGSNDKSDLNLDGVINAIDRNEYQQKNNATSTQVPGS